MKLNNEIFNIGDYVTLINADGIHTLEKYKSYQIIYIEEYHHVIPKNGATQKLYFDKDDMYKYYNCKRFTKNIKPLRKKKLQNIYQEQ
jgi:hypothetical protein